MKRFRRIVSSGALLAAATWLAPAACLAQKKDELPHPKTLEELQKAMKDVLDKAHVPGAGVALVQKGEVLWCGGIGKADLDRKSTRLNSSHIQKSRMPSSA